MKSFCLTTTLTCISLLFSCGRDNSNYDAIGSFEATEVIVSAEASGRILVLDIEEGEQLTAGQMVGAIDSTQLYLRKMSLLSSAKGVRARRPNIGTQTAAIREQIRILEREQERVERLLEANAANRKQLDDITSQIEILSQQLMAQTSTLQKSSEQITAESSSVDIQIAQLDDQLAKTRISSPNSGTVLNRYAEMGELATMGMPLFKIADTGTLFLRAYVTNDQLAGIRLNDSVTVRVDNGRGEMNSYPGRISWISDKSEFTPKTIQTKNERANLVYALKIAVINDGYLKIGMYGEVKL